MSRLKISIRIALAAAAVALIFVGGFGLANAINPSRVYYGNNPSLNPTSVADNGNLSGTSDPSALAAGNSLQAYQNAYRAIAAAVLPVVVRVDIEKNVRLPAGGPLQFFFNGQPFGGGGGGDGNGDGNDNGKGNNGPMQRQGGFGSGIIVEQKGDTVYVLTNNHVVDGADKYVVRTHDNKSFDAKLVGADKNRDLALISFTSKEKMSLAKLGDSSQVRPGDIVFAVGSPYGIANTITQGIVSAVGRTGSDLPGGGGDTARGFTDYLQTDAAINPGNSGGALVNINGEVIGINTWIATRTGENVGLGFAVPINNARKVAVDFLTKGKVEYGWLGIKTGNIIDEARKDMKLSADQQGAFAFSLIKGSPAEKSGILPGDVITNVNGTQINSADDLIRTISGQDVNSEVKVKLIRNGQTMDLKVKLGLRDDKADVSAWPGFSVIPMTDDLRKELQDSQSGPAMNKDTKDPAIPNGALVVVAVDDGSNATNAGLKPGDTISGVSGQPVKSVGEFYQALNKSGGNIDLQIKRNGRDVSLSFQK